MYETHGHCETYGKGHLYKIGMFAQMNHVTVKALRFYEEQGLLSPAFVDEENGYEICGNIRESYIDGVWNRESEKEWLSEIQIPVRKRD